MIGLKRRDNEDKSSLIMRKKMRLGQNSQISKINSNLNGNNIVLQNNKLVRKNSEENFDYNNINNNDDQDLNEINRQENFLHREEMEECNFDDNF